MPKAVYRNQELFPLRHYSDAISGQTRKSFQIISEHQNIEKIGISRLELKIIKLEIFQNLYFKIS